MKRINFAERNPQIDKGNDLRKGLSTSSGVAKAQHKSRENLTLHMAIL
jgi:hypothetical protein